MSLEFQKQDFNAKASWLRLSARSNHSQTSNGKGGRRLLVFMILFSSKGIKNKQIKS